METPQPLTAFIFANGDPNDGPLVRHILAAHPDAWIIAADGGARQAAYYGRTVQTLIGDMDSLDADEVAALAAAGAHVLRRPAEKDETDLELALLHAQAGGAQAIRIFAALGDRLDQTLGNIFLLALPALRGLDIRLAAGRQEARLLFPGRCPLGGAAGDTLSLLPLTAEAQGISTDGLHYPLRDETLRFGPARGMSNVLLSDEASLTFSQGILLAVRTIGRA